jgi:hypothetical protein
MKRRAIYAGLVVVLAVWMVLANYSFELLSSNSDSKLYAGALLILGSIVVFPTIIRKLFGKQVKQDLNAVIDDSLGEHKEEKE